MSEHRSIDMLIRTEADSKVGMGHLKRCLTLGHQLGIEGKSVALIARAPFSPSVMRVIGNVPVLTLSEKETDVLLTEHTDARASIALLKAHAADSAWVIVDHYGLGELWERSVRGAGYQVLAIDDFRNRTHCADVLLSDSATPFGTTFNKNTDAAVELLGPKFALLDRAFQHEPTQAPPCKVPTKLLITYGGADLTGETVKALEALRILATEHPAIQFETVDVAVGPVNAQSESVARTAEGLKQVRLHQAPNGLAPLMRGADLILTAGGNSMIEALALLKPCLVTTTATNQMGTVLEMERQGVIRSLGLHAQINPQILAQAIEKVISEFPAFQNYVRLHPLFDCLGAARVTERMRRVSETKSRMRAAG